MKMNWKSCRALSFEKKKKKGKERKERKKKNFHFSFSLSWISPFVTLGEILFHCELWIEMVGSTGDFTS